MSSREDKTGSAGNASGHGGRTAWAGNPPQSEAARARLLEATARCIERDGLAGLTVAGIAGEAGVSRQTVYRYFKGREELALKAIRAVAERLRAKLDFRLQALADPADMVVETLILGLGEVRSDPVLRAISDPSALDGLIATYLTQPAGGIAWSREALSQLIDAAEWNEDEVDARLELILRVFLSFVISPAPERTPEELRAFLYRHLVPGLGLGDDEGGGEER